MIVSILIVVAGILVNLVAALDAGIRYRRNKMSGLFNGSLVYFRAHALSKTSLLFGQIVLLRMIFIIPEPGNIEVAILRGVLSISMSATAYINMSSFRRLRDGK